jgi:uncharacterized protein (TIGR02996 family)
MALSRNLELEAAIVEQPTDCERVAVYGDWLAQRGDPRGALMVAGAELASTVSKRRGLELRRIIAELWQERGDEVTGSLGGLAQHGLSLEWRMGCVHTANLMVPLDDAGAATTAQLLAHPAAFVLSRMTVRTELLGEHGFNYQPIVDLVSEEAPLSLRALSLGALDGWTDDETVVLGDLRPLFGRHMQLESVTLAGRASTVSAPWALPSLTELVLRPIGLSRTWLRVINAEAWPSLRRMTFSYVSALDDDIGWLCSSRVPQRYPRLTSLAVIGTGDALGVIDALGATGLSRQLEEIDLSWGRFGDAAIHRMRADRADFPVLRTLFLERGASLVRLIRDELSWLEVRTR